MVGNRLENRWIQKEEEEENGSNSSSRDANKRFKHDFHLLYLFKAFDDLK